METGLERALNLYKAAVKNKGVLEELNRPSTGHDPAEVHDGINDLRALGLVRRLTGTSYEITELGEIVYGHLGQIEKILELADEAKPDVTALKAAFELAVDLADFGKEARIRREEGQDEVPF